MNVQRSNWFLMVLLGGTLVSQPSAMGAFVYENLHEFTVASDFDGNGQPDVVVVDRATGNYRLAYQQSPGSYNWVAPRASGIENVSGLGIGRLLSDTLDALAFTSPEANRINVLGANSPATASQPKSMFVPSIGPSQVVALDIGGAGNTVRDDLFAGSVLNGFSSDVYNLTRNANGSALSPLSSGSLLAAPARANAVRLKTGAPTLVGVLLRTLGSDTFKAFDVSAGTLTEVASTSSGLPWRADYVYGNFNSGSPLAQFLFYHPGSNGLYLRVVQEPTPGNFSFASGSTFNLGSPLRQVFAVQQGSSTRLLIIFGNGESARLYDFDGSSFPVAGQVFTPPNGEAFTTAAILPNGNFLMLSGAPGSGTSTRFQSYSFNGSTYVPGQSGSLPVLSDLSHTANVLNFNLDPFAGSGATLLGSLNAGDWSSRYQLLGGAVNVNAETFGGAQAGLGSPTAMNLGTPPSGTTYGLVNQYSNEISLFSLARPIGDEVADVAISPPPGEYKTSLQITLSSQTASVTIFYRIDGVGNWQTYSAPFWIFKNTFISYYAQPNAGPASAKSAIHTARYAFPEGPGTLDSDGDGVPDYVEIAKGLDPFGSGNDHDEDGFYDLDELVNGYNPNDANNHPPTSHSRPELHAAVDLIQTLRPWDGTLNTSSVASNGTIVQSFDLDGALFVANTVITDPMQTGVSTPAVILSNIVVDTGMRLLAVGAEPHYDVVTPSTDKRIGRELLRLFDATGFSQPIQLPVTWTGGMLNTEADAWVVTASNQLHSIVRERIVGDMRIFDTLTALLVERKIQETLLSRGLNQYSNITLFPFRPADVERTNPPAADLLALETKLDDMHPGYSLSQTLRIVENLVELPPGSGPDNLKNVTRDIYRLSSSSNNVPPNATNGWPLFPSPVNTLRDFICTGVLHSNYLARTTIPGGSLAAAYNEARSILDSIAPRPLTNVTLLVRSDTFDGPCTLLSSLDQMKTWSLLQPDGSPYHILQAFNLLPGSKVFVTGYADVTNMNCAAFGLEVLSVSLEFVPVVTPEDSDGDLFLDALELALFGDLSQNGFGDADGDGYSNAEEQFVGTDPKNPLSFPPVAPANLGPPQMFVQTQPGSGTLSITWFWPAAYASKVNFQVLSTSTLGVPFTPSSLTPTQAGRGRFEVIIQVNPGPPNAPATQFFQLLMSLK